MSRPIIFSASMVRALLDGRKHQTRRVLKPQPGELDNVFRDRGGFWHVTDSRGAWMSELRVPYAPGDRLWVREAWARVGDTDDDIHACPDLRIWAYYRADAVDPQRQRWRSPIHMPRWASRLTLTVTDVRVQRVQEISEDDARAEGIERLKSGRGFYDPTVPHAAVRFGEWTSTARQGFQRLWNSLHGPGAWDANPWVAAITFTIQRGNIDT